MPNKTLKRDKALRALPLRGYSWDRGIPGSVYLITDKKVTEGLNFDQFGYVD